MTIFKNKHFMTASIVAPILALIGYFGINAIVGESPHAAEEGKSYQLVEMPNCRYSSGNCGLKNGNFLLTLSPEPRGEDRLLLTLESLFPLEGVMAALVESEAAEKQPVEMQSLGEDGLVWSMEIARPDPENHRLHLVASAQQSLYYGDVAMKFTVTE